MSAGGPLPAGDGAMPAADAAAAPIDLVLGEGIAAGRELGPLHAESLAALRTRLQYDPLLAIEVAETRDLIERCRGLTVATSPVFAARLHDVVQRAALRAPQPKPAAGFVLLGHRLLGLCAALLTVALLLWLDPLQAKTRVPAAAVLASSPLDLTGTAPAASVAVQAERTTAMVAFETAVARMRERLAAEGSAGLQRELEAGLAAPVDPLQRWLDPQHALVELRLGHELRPKRELRQAALRAAGSLLVVDDRVQALADSVAEELLATSEARARWRAAAAAAADEDAEGWPTQALGAEPQAFELPTQALAMQALLAAGLTSERRELALSTLFDELAAALPHLAGEGLVAVLPAMAEYAAMRGVGSELVRHAGERLLDEVLRPDADSWGRWLPVLLSRKVPTALLADGGRMGKLLPAFGLPPDRCLLLRRLWLGQLRERMLVDRGPEPMAAALYGFADLLAPGEVDSLALELQRWQPARLVPDYATVQHLVWGMEPGLPGHTRVRAGLRRLAAASDPADLGARARLCLALACHYAARPLQSAALMLGQ